MSLTCLILWMRTQVQTCSLFCTNNLPVNFDHFFCKICASLLLLLSLTTSSFIQTTCMIKSSAAHTQNQHLSYFFFLTCGNCKVPIFPLCSLSIILYATNQVVLLNSYTLKCEDLKFYLLTSSLWGMKECQRWGDFLFGLF